MLRNHEHSVKEHSANLLHLQPYLTFQPLLCLFNIRNILLSEKQISSILMTCAGNHRRTRDLLKTKSMLHLNCPRWVGIRAKAHLWPALNIFGISPSLELASNSEVHGPMSLSLNRTNNKGKRLAKSLTSSWHHPSEFTYAHPGLRSSSGLIAWSAVIIGNRPPLTPGNRRIPLATIFSR